MNFYLQTQKWLAEHIEVFLKEHGVAEADAPAVTIEPPRQRGFGDVASPIAMQLARALKRAPFQIAEEIVARLPENDLFAKIDVIKPGFINFTLSDTALYDLLREVDSTGGEFARGAPEPKRRVMVEFVSANADRPASRRPRAKRRRGRHAGARAEDGRARCSSRILL